MSHPNVKEILIREENHLEGMREKAEPVLAACGEVRTLYREKTHPINCVRYLPEAPEAVVVISHGFIESADKYKEMIYYFLQAHYAVYAFDYCEHGKSYRLTEDLSKVHADGFERYRDDLLYVARFAASKNEGLPLYLYAHSMGGGVGAYALSAEPELFNKAILTAPMIRPATGGVPWFLTRLICAAACGIGKAESYAPSQHAYDGSDIFEESASTSLARYEYYQRKRRSDPLYQMNGATYGWLRSAVKMNIYLQDRGWQQIQTPVLLFQADNDGFVINDQQDLFIRKLSERSEARLIHIPGSKHEIFNSTDDVMEGYLEEIFTFYDGESAFS